MSFLAWKIPWMEEPGGCSPWGHYKSDATERLHFHFSLSRNGEGNGNPLQCSCLENPRDGRAWWAAVYGVAQSRKRLKQLSNTGVGCNCLLWKILLQHHNWKASVLWCSAFFYDTILTSVHANRKTQNFDYTELVSKLLTLLFNTLSRHVIDFLPKSKHLLISCLHLPSTVILKPKKRKSVTAFTFLPWSSGTVCHNLSFLNVEF